MGVRARWTRKIVGMLVMPWIGLAGGAGLADPAAPGTEVEQLWEAARQGDEGRVRELLAAGAPPNAANAGGGSALLFASQRGHAGVVRKLLEHGADPDTRETVNGMSALHFAAAHPQVVARLLEHGARRDVEDLQLNQAPLGWAVFHRQRRSLELLLSGGEGTSAMAGPAATLGQVQKALALAHRIGEPELIAPLERYLEDSPPPSWPRFRGVGARGNGDGMALPLRWDAITGEGLAWKTAIPGLGHSSPVVWGDRVFVTTAVTSAPFTDHGPGGPMDMSRDTTPHSLRLYCLDLQTGRVRWSRTVYQGELRERRHPKNSHASPTPATDGRRVVVYFGAHGLHAFDVEGRKLWSRDLGEVDAGFALDPAYQWGSASSPILYRDRVILQVDVQPAEGGGSFLFAWDADHGTPLWRTPRDELPSWGTPVVWRGRESEVVTNGVRAVRGYRPGDGELLWSLPTDNSLISAASPVATPDLLLVANGYRPLKPIYAIRPGARGALEAAAGGPVLWHLKSGGSYYITPLPYQGNLYMLSEGGILAAYVLATGERIYRRRVGDGGGAEFSASPVAANGYLYLASEDGNVYVVRSGIEGADVAVNPVGEPIHATPALVGGHVLVRGRDHLFAFRRGAGEIDGSDQPGGVKGGSR